MSRTFNGSSDKVTFLAGGLASIAQGAVTFGAILRLHSSHRGGLVSMTQAGTRKYGVNPFDNGQIFMAVSGFTASAFDYSTFLNQWIAVLFSKPAGNGQTVRSHLYRFEGGGGVAGTWTHTNLGTVSAQAGSAIDAITVGLFDSGQWLNAELAVMGMFAANLSDANCESGLASSLSAWQALTPAALWPFNQAATATAIPDLTGGGANQDVLTGTSVSAAEPPGFAYSSNVDSAGVLRLALLGIGQGAKRAGGVGQLLAPTRGISEGAKRAAGGALLPAAARGVAAGSRIAASAATGLVAVDGQGAGRRVGQGAGRGLVAVVTETRNLVTSGSMSLDDRPGPSMKGA